MLVIILSLLGIDFICFSLWILGGIYGSDSRQEQMIKDFKKGTDYFTKKYIDED